MRKHDQRRSYNRRYQQRLRVRLPPHKHGNQNSRSDRTQRHEPSQQHDRDEDHARAQQRDRREHEKDPNTRRHAFAAAKSQPHRKNVSHQRGNRSRRDHPISTAKSLRDQHCHATLRRIKQQRQHARSLACSPRNIRRPGSTRSGLANIRPRLPRHDQITKRQPSEQVRNNPTDDPCQPWLIIYSNRRRRRSSAACEERQRIRLRSPGTLRRRCSVFTSSASAMKTVPTGFSSVPPPGPAIPVIDNPKSVPMRLRTPSAIASATGALTAPCSINNIGSTSNSFVFTSFAYAITPPIKYFDDPGTSVTRCASRPPVQLSATASVYPPKESFNPTTSSIVSPANENTAFPSRSSICAAKRSNNSTASFSVRPRAVRWISISL